MQKRRKKPNYSIFIILTLLILCLLAVLLLIKDDDSTISENAGNVTQEVTADDKETLPESASNSEESSESEPSTELESGVTSEFQPIYTSAGIIIQEVKSYAGKYLEDGSDEIVSNVMALLVKNDTEESIQLADLSVADKAGNTYEFRITTLLPGQEMLVLENNRAIYDATVELDSVDITSLALFSETPSLHEDIFEIQGTDNLITIKNISEETISAARICYKNISSDIYIGGITYTVSIPQLLPGETLNMPTRHFTEDASEVVFVTYAK